MYIYEIIYKRIRLVFLKGRVGYEWLNFLLKYKIVKLVRG